VRSVAALRQNARMASTRKLLAALLSAALLTGGVTACSSDDGPQSVVDEFLAGWRSGNLDKVGLVKPAGDKLASSAVVEEIKALSGVFNQTTPTLTSKKVDVIESNATAEVAVSQPLPDGAAWEYTTSFRLTKAKDSWVVLWEPAVVHPKLNSGDRLETRRIAATRGGVLDGKGQELVKLRPVVVIGLVPQEVKDLDKVVSELGAVLAPLGITVTDLPARMAAAKPDHFVEVVTLRLEDYTPIRDRVRALAGTRFREEQRMLAPSRTFATPLLGTVGPVTKEIMDANPNAYVVGQQAGLGGLQRQYDERLRGKAGMKIVASRKAPDGTTQDNVLHTFEAQNGSALKLTLDPGIQAAAEQAMNGTGQRAAVVAIRISDGQIVAVANNRAENLAFNAQVPPGSIFKAVSALGLLDAGKVTADQIVPCPQFFSVEGRQFKNSENFELGPVPFHTDFAKSCNTAFAALAPQLGPTGLAAAGATLGLGQQWDLGTPAFTGKVSQNGNATEQAAASFGQGQTIVSPVSMAGVAAAIARGQWKQPTLLLDPAPAKPAADGPQLKPTSVEPLRAMMREVVTAGTATQLAGTPNGAVHGKTGTAEYDNNPANTHAWFIGWQNDIAFAIFVEQGTSPASTAVPITDRFLRALPR
jgi:cell division protein FtsI/penicillin-binding protein 2